MVLRITFSTGGGASHRAERPQQSHTSDSITEHEAGKKQ
jgi:hypothetical protein